MSFILFTLSDGQYLCDCLLFMKILVILVRSLFRKRANIAFQSNNVW